MANMEKIIRPHLPPNIAPTTTVAKCQVAAENKVLTFGKDSNANATTRTTTTNTSYSYNGTGYMTKQERETSVK
jgi:hypothetical protein